MDLEHLLDPPEEYHVPTLQLCLDTLVWRDSMRASWVIVTFRRIGHLGHWYFHEVQVSWVSFRRVRPAGSAHLLVHPKPSSAVITPCQSPSQEMPSVCWIPCLPEQVMTAILSYNVNIYLTSSLSASTPAVARFLLTVVISS